MPPTEERDRILTCSTTKHRYGFLMVRIMLHIIKLGGRLLIEAKHLDLSKRWLNLRSGLWTNVGDHQCQKRGRVLDLSGHHVQSIILIQLLPLQKESVHVWGYDG